MAASAGTRPGAGRIARGLALALGSILPLSACSAPRGSPAFEPAPALELERWSASWCEPCHRMEREAWGDPAVMRWLANGARVTSRDLDAEAESARRIGVEAIPCVVARRDGHELGRLVGFHAAEPLLQWLETLAGGGTDVDAARAAAESAPADPDVLHRLASALSAAGRTAEAARTLARVWALPRGARGSLAVRLVDETRALADADAEARTVLRAPRDGLAARARTDDAALQDWIELSVATGLDADVARWFVELADPAARRAPIVAARESLWPALRASDEYGALVTLVELSVPARTWAANALQISDFERTHFGDPAIVAFRAQRRERVEDLCRGLVELGRTAEAEEISRILAASKLR